jgi:hypothetical protein
MQVYTVRTSPQLQCTTNPNCSRWIGGALVMGEFVKAWVLAEVPRSNPLVSHTHYANQTFSLISQQ